MRRFLVVSSVALAIAGCVAPPVPKPVAPTRPVAVAPPSPTPALPPVAADWNDWPYTPGEWGYAHNARDSAAVFGPTGRSFVIVLRCDQSSHQLILDLPIGAPVTIRTTSITRSIMPGRLEGDYSTMVSFAANDPLLDAIVFSRGRFVIEQAGQPPLVLPPHAEIGRVIEDCRG